MPRKRRPTACDLCRSRKIRCNVLSVGNPCSNCLRHASRCLVSVALSAPSQLKHAIPSARTHKFKFKTGPAHVDEGNSDPARLSSSPLLRSLAGDEDLEHIAVNDEVSHSDPAHIHLPAYITPLPKTIDLENLQVLVQMNALAFPPAELANDMIQSFICYVYPLLPILRLDDFLAAIEGEHGKTISPLLFQAVLFAGAVFTDFSHSQHPSFRQCKDAQKLLFSRVKLLYDMEVETNPLIMIQSLLLMTYWHSQLNDTKGRVYWLRIALSLATEIGLHNSDLQYGEPEEDNLRRRLWCCCLIRSQLISIGERRQVVLPCAAEINLSFEQWNGGSLSQALDAYSVTHTRQQMDILGCIFIQEVKLCGIIRHILDTLYELSGVRKVPSSDSIMMLIPKAKATGPLVIALDETLREWYKNASQSGAFDCQHGDHDSIVSVHSATLEMLYHTALSAVHRPLMLQQRQHGPATEAMREFSSTTLRSSACRITEIGRDLEIQNEISHLPPVATAIFIAASIQHLKDAMSPNLEKCQSGSFYLGHTLRIFRLLVDRYNHVNTAIEFISRAQNGEHFDHSVEWEDRVDPNRGSQPDSQNSPTDLGGLRLKDTGILPTLDDILAL
ncbi:hypothetical protein H2200_004872 [Cladophialophora chaetospira]|uniref:Zn(2)-C6 fungal-type domain-containing protein n=1 Tax=Cladophialophora chaetospira TaxID=386627 RepID=A0AA39CKK3_9EURO|nr:hypothetical protein H2200_004872 [Cladophialophora chaetospira]